jgi:hypothetical protein
MMYWKEKRVERPYAKDVEGVLMCRPLASYMGVPIEHGKEDQCL